MAKCTNQNHTERYANGRCIECAREGKLRHYYANKQQYYDRNKKREEEKVAYVRKVKEVSCVDCDIQYPYFVMDLHHLNPYDKIHVVARLVKLGNWKKLIDEVNKCIVLCSNCHRIRTHEEIF